MSVLVVKCSDHSNTLFIHLTKQELANKQISIASVASAEEASLKRKNSIVLGKIVEFINLSHDSQPVVVLMREILCNGKNSKYFTAIIHKQLRIEFINVKPEIGDKIAFFEPYVFKNPALTKGINSLERFPTHIVEVGETFMIYAKNDLSKFKKTNGKKHINSKETEVVCTNPSSMNQSNMKVDILNSPTQRKPSIQLPVNPQLPGNKKRLNPQYNYITVKEVMSSTPVSGRQGRANMFVVVKEVTKALSRIPSGKFTIICKVMDDSIDKKELLTCEELSKTIYLSIHFFTVDDVIIKQIESGDILRLHRVQIELFNDVIDGRVFSSHDIMLFKSNSSAPISVAKNTVFNENDMKRVTHLKNWFNDLNRTVLLESIQQEGVFTVNCMITAQPSHESDNVILKVSDGSKTSHFYTSFPVKRSQENQGIINNGTVIEISQMQGKFLNLNYGDFIRLNCLKASFNNRPKMCLLNPISFCHLDEASNEILDIKQRLELIDQDNELVHNELVTAIPDGNRCLEKTTDPPDDANKTSLLGNEINVVDQDVNNGLKPRKALFSANYADLSDATEEETLENLEALNNDGGNQENQSKEDVTPANTTFGDLIELVKTRYCSPRQFSSTEGDLQELPSPMLNHHYKGVHEHQSVHDGIVGSNTRFRKRKLNAAEVKNIKQVMDDDSTVINVSLQDNKLKPGGFTNKNIRLESKSTATNGELTNVQYSSELSCRYTPDSVLQWLFHPNNKHTSQMQHMAETGEVEASDIIQLLDGEYSKSPELSHFLNSNINRCQVFLKQVAPDPSIEPLDLISGFCNMGCQKFFLFSTIKWVFNEENLPLCPFCTNINQERELELIFLFELQVMTPFGSHDTVIVCRENAEVFLGCTVNEYVNNSVIRASRVQMLNEYSLLNTINAFRTPLMDISVALKDRKLCLVDSKLKHPNLV